MMAKDAGCIDMNMRDLVSQMKLSIRVVGMREFTLRKAVAFFFLRLGVWILGAKVSIDVD